MTGLSQRAGRLMLVLAAALGAATAARAQDAPPVVISPLLVEPDQNGVNLVSGKTSIDAPVLSVPGAPNLRFDRVQNAAPYVSGRISGGPGEVPQASYSVHNGTGSSESFQCPDYDCASVTGTGSTFQPNGLRIYRQAGTGARWTFDVYHVDTAGPPRVLLYYASQVLYPNGETISYTYETAYLPGDPFNRPFRRPITITSSLGYYIAISYQPGALGEMGWNSPAQATLYATGNGTPLQQLTYSGNTITDLGGRTYTCTGCNNGLGTDLETASGTLQLPTEGSVSRVITAHPTAPVVTLVTNDGVGWNYSYLNLRSQATTQSWLFDRVTVTGPNGFNQIYNIVQVGPPTQYRNVIASTTDSIGRTTSFLFDEAYRPYRVVYPEGNQVDVSYDAYGNLNWRRTRPKPGSGQPDIIEQAYFPGASLPNLCTVSCWRPTWSRDGLNRQTDYAYNGNGQLTEQIDPADANGVRRRTSTIYAVSPGGISRRSAVRICADTGATCGTNAPIQTEYDYAGPVLLPSAERRIDLAQGVTLTTAFTYDAAGRLTSTNGPLTGDADATYIRYDVFGRKEWEIGAVGANGLRLATHNVYRSSDNKVSYSETGTLPDQYSSALTVLTRTDITYDSRRYPIRTAASAGGATSSVLDKAFDDRGRLVCTATRMNPAAYGEMPGACLLTTTSPTYGPDRITVNLYDNASQLLQEIRAYLTPQQQNYATYTYNPNGTVRTLADANGNTNYFNYDGYDRRDYWVMPSRTATGSWDWSDYEYYAYDAVGNRTYLRKRDGSALTYQYDNLNRVIVKVVPERAGLDPSNTRDVYYAYNLRNQQTEARFDSLSGDGVSNTYDGFGWQSSSTTRWGAMVRSLYYSYDPAGRRGQITHPDAQTFQYNYSPAGELTSIYRNGSILLDSFTYNSQSRLATRTESAGSNVGYTYDPPGRLASITDTFVGGTGNVALGFSYNPANQITQRTRNNDSYASNTAYNVSRGYTVNGLNQYTAAGGAGFTYDANGNLISDGTNTYTYDVENRLVARSGGVQLGYDPLGRLAWSTGNPNFTRFLYDGDALVAEYDYGGALTARYVHGSNVGADDPLVWYDSSGTVHWLHSDHQGSIVGITNGSGAVSSINAYDSWGIPNAGNVGRFQYTGQAWLGELGMYHYKARIYSPTLGRFLQTDPVGYDDQINLYAYVGNDPVNGTDPEGTHTFTCTVQQQRVTSCTHSDDGSSRVTLVVRSVNQDGSITRMSRVIGDTNGDIRSYAELSSRISAGIQQMTGLRASVTVEPPSARAALPPPIASSPVGRSGNPNEVRPGTNSPTTINGRQYTGHALDQMQGRGIPPSAVENTIQTGRPSPGNTPGTTRYYDPRNNLSVITNSRGGVITVRPGN